MGKGNFVTLGIQQERVKPLNSKPCVKGDYVIYWMQASQRVLYNHALEYAVGMSNELKLPLVVYFGLATSFPEANVRHYRFMLEGLQEVKRELSERSITMHISLGDPQEGILCIAQRAAMVVTDRGYLRMLKDWRRYAADRINCAMVQVESDVVVPVEHASSKEEYSAATLRPKIKRLLFKYLVPLHQAETVARQIDLQVPCLEIADIDGVIARLDLDNSVAPSPMYTGGTSRAVRRLEAFLTGLDRYPVERNDPNLPAQSGMSPYLHFGQVSPLYIALKVLEGDSPGSDAFIEELIIRRELAINFVNYNPAYDTYDALPAWCRKTLEEHASDRRPFVYSVEDLEKAQTHDKYWNAAQLEMVHTGKMHGYMRMYWGKKILEWSHSAREAYSTAVFLNNKFELDGRDACSYAGVAWCLGKHDRPWAERPVFGSIRYMNEKGLKRKFAMEKYVETKADWKL